MVILYKHRAGRKWEPELRSKGKFIILAKSNRKKQTRKRIILKDSKVKEIEGKNNKGAK